jgi:hypothetical protein
MNRVHKYPLKERKLKGTKHHKIHTKKRRRKYNVMGETPQVTQT